jgi:DNA-binding XRE family transcriptional regulator
MTNKLSKYEQKLVNGLRRCGYEVAFLASGKIAVREIPIGNITFGSAPPYYFNTIQSAFEYMVPIKRHMLSEYKRAADIFKRVRNENRVSLRQLAKTTGVNHSKINRFENGKPIEAIDYLILAHWMTTHRQFIQFESKDL